MSGALLKHNGNLLQTPTGAYGIKNLVPENVKSGVNIGGVVGNYTGEGKTVLSTSVTLTNSAKSITISNVNFTVKKALVDYISYNSAVGLIYSVIIDKDNDYYGAIANSGGYFQISNSSSRINFNQSNTTVTINYNDPYSSAKFLANQPYSVILISE